MPSTLRLLVTMPSWSSQFFRFVFFPFPLHFFTFGPIIPGILDYFWSYWSWCLLHRVFVYAGETNHVAQHWVHAHCVWHLHARPPSHVQGSQATCGPCS